MKSKEINNWVQIIGILAVIGSLVFVGLEINQDQRLARAELGAQSFDNTVDLELVLSDRDMANAFSTILKSI